MAHSFESLFLRFTPALMNLFMTLMFLCSKKIQRCLRLLPDRFHYSLQIVLCRCHQMIQLRNGLPEVLRTILRRGGYLKHRWIYQGGFLDLAMASIKFWADFSPVDQARQVFLWLKNKIGRIGINRASKSWAKLFLPKPSISSAPRDAKWRICSFSWAGQEILTQRCATSPSNRQRRNHIRGSLGAFKLFRIGGSFSR